MAELADPFTRINLSENQRRAMLADIQQRAPEEGCGLLGGKANKVFAVIPVTNVARSKSRYRMDPSEQLRAFQRLEAHGLEISGIYHSHPAGPAHPSNTDIVEAYYPETVYLIWSKRSDGWVCRAFRMADGSFREVEIWIAPD
jgi:[CysO sulfur-carrier protein]-S-L-cysteine hydrolase